MIGKGEAACIALTKVHHGILASNNLSDVQFYIDLYHLHAITTPTILLKAVVDGVITENEANSIWIRMVGKKRKLPFATFTEYRKSV